MKINIIEPTKTYNYIKYLILIFLFTISFDFNHFFTIHKNALKNRLATFSLRGGDDDHWLIFCYFL